MKFLKELTFICIFYVVMYFGVDFILEKIYLQFRSWMRMVSTVSIIVIIFNLLLLLIQPMIRVSDFEFHLWSEIISGIGILMGGVFLFFSVYIVTFSYEPEHIVQRDGYKMVAKVDSFVQVVVYYYFYKNCFVMGRDHMIKEEYGNGSYDPFKSSEMPAPRSIDIYY